MVKWMTRAVPLLFLKEQEDDSGFTLMEVLVALAILSLSLGVLLAIFSQSLDRARHNQLEMKARVFAKALLERTNVPGQMKLGQSAGETSDGLAWSLTVKPFGSADDQASWTNLPVEVAARVDWSDGEVRHTSELKTLRLLASQP